MTVKPFEPTIEQRKVIEHRGSAFISACPGSGKTRVMVARQAFCCAALRDHAVWRSCPTPTPLSRSSKLAFAWTVFCRRLHSRTTSENFRQLYLAVSHCAVQRAGMHGPTTPHPG